MTPRTLEQLIDQVLDDVAAHPERLVELKQSLHDRIDVPAEPANANGARAQRAGKSAEQADDEMWDNMPV